MQLIELQYRIEEPKRQIAGYQAYFVAEVPFLFETEVSKPI